MKISIAAIQANIRSVCLTESPHMHAQLPKKGAGSHNRSTPKAMVHLQAAINRESPCACILHKTAPGQATVLPNSRFNRQGTGIQSMCRDGKTLIDALKHQLWRLTHAILLDAIAQRRFDTPTWAATLALPTLNSEAKALIRSLRTQAEVVAFESTLAASATALDHYLHASKALEKTLTLKNLGVYRHTFADEHQARAAWDALNAALGQMTAIALFHQREPHLQRLLEQSGPAYWVQESASSGIYHPAASMSRNWSKMNSLYKVLRNGTFVPAGLRGPFHNTKMAHKGNSGGDRLVRFLTEMRFNEGTREVDRHITRHRKPGEHADHILPIALGGRHSIANLTFLPAQDNMDKGDTLTYAAYAQALGPQGFQMVNGDAFLVLRDAFERIGLDAALFAQERPHIEGALRQAMETRIRSFAAAGEGDKRALLARYRPDLNHAQQTLFLERFARKRHAL